MFKTIGVVNSIQTCCNFFNMHKKRISIQVNAKILNLSRMKDLLKNKDFINQLIFHHKLISLLSLSL